MLRKQKDNMQNDGRFAFLIKDTFFCKEKGYVGLLGYLQIGSQEMKPFFVQKFQLFLQPLIQPVEAGDGGLKSDCQNQPL